MNKPSMLSKTMSVILWTLTFLMVAQFVLAGIPKLLMSEGDVRRFENWGYGTAFLVLIGVMELGGALLLMLPRTAAYGACILIAVMIGAAYTHITSGNGSPVTAIVNILLLLVIAWRRLPHNLARNTPKMNALDVPENQESNGT